MKFVNKKKQLLLGIILYFGIMPLALGITLFDEQIYRSPIADKVAYFPGDILTIIIMETSNAQSSTDLSSDKELKTALEASYSVHKRKAALSFKGDGKAKAKTARNGNIKATLTVKIKTILPNRSYEVEGHQKIQINGEQQTITLDGIVRPEDISPQNTVLSTRLGNAHIIYTGIGAVSYSQQHNYLYRVLSFMGFV
jgi:flagellar L-ring protein precursor FlgH